MRRIESVLLKLALEIVTSAVVCEVIALFG